MLHIALYEPKIPQNTGNIIRLAANVGFSLHLIEPLGFNFEDKNLKRSGLDYFDIADVIRYPSYSNFLEKMSGRDIYLITTRGFGSYEKINYKPEDVLLFGSETEGVSDSVRQSIPIENHLRIPMKPSNRSMNLSNSVAVVCYEAWRQLGFQNSI